MIWTAFSLGFLGSFHCIGMCGPIALSLPLPQQNRAVLVLHSFLYHLGRAVTYASLGLLIGTIGEGIFIAGFQRWISVITGIVLIFVALWGKRMEAMMFQIPGFLVFYRWIQQRLGWLLREPFVGSTFFIGLLNGLLPCGLVYVAIVGALLVGNIWESAIYMFVFGLGTMPMMILVTVFGKMIDFNWKAKVRKVYPVFLFAVAGWCIYRGLNFSVPHDFSFWEAMQNIPMCH